MAKKIIDDIDEKALLASIDEKKNPNESAKEITFSHSREDDRGDNIPNEIQDLKEERTKNKRKKSTDYESIFLQKKEFKTRQCVYISLNVHEKIQKLVRSFVNQGLTLGGYIDTVLLEHLEASKEEINDLYRKSKEEDDKII